MDDASHNSSTVALALRLELDEQAKRLADAFEMSVGEVYELALDLLESSAARAEARGEFLASMTHDEKTYYPIEIQPIEQLRQKRIEEAGTPSGSNFS
jgi:hypothetical protein